MKRYRLSVGAVAFSCVLAAGFGAKAADGTSAAPSLKLATAGIEAQGAMTPAAKPATVPNCARKVKVVYAGYGEAERANCATASVSTTAVQ
jgi:hypothetical protein